MANTMKNRITVNGNEEQVQEIFCWIIPGTVEYHGSQFEIIGLNRDYLHKKYKKLTNPDFSIDEDWNDKQTAGLIKCRDKNTVIFASKWRPNINFILNVSFYFPEVEFCYEFSDEDFGCRVGAVIIQNGEVKSQNIPPHRSDEAFDMAHSIWGPEWRDTIEQVKNCEIMAPILYLDDI